MALKWRGFGRLLWAAPLLLGAGQPALAKEAPRAAKESGSKGAEAAAPAPKPVVQDYPPRPAIWLLEDDDTRIYLFGTIHMLPPGFKWRSPALEGALNGSDALVVESYSTAEEELAMEAQVLPLLMLPKPRPFLKRFPKKDRAAIREGIRQSGIPSESLAMMQTWAGGMMIGLAGLIEDYGADSPDDVPGVEDVLEAEFKAAGKPILSIEEPIAVLRSISALPEEVQIAMMTAQEPDGPATEAEAEAEAADEKNLHDWAQGRPEGLTRDIEGLPAEMYEVLVTRRNAAWTEWLSRRLEKPGTIFVAVGAGHLAGADSVQAMLEKRGLQAKRFD
jgi:hypothetical protein